MPKTKQRRTFTACWTCRGRNIRCDAGVPRCSQCTRSRIVCEGYSFNLVWVDSETGNYIPHQRRTYPCHLTWQGHPPLTLKEVDHLINDCKDRQCRCRLHQENSPFSAFLQACENVNRAEAYGEDMSKDVSPSPMSSNHTEVICERQDKTPIIKTTRSSFSEFTTLESQSPDDSGTSFSRSQDSVKPNAGLCVQRYTRKTSTLLSTRPTQPWMVDASHDNNKLFHHFLVHLAKRMVPVDDDSNPWKTIYPSLAMQTTRSQGSEALYHALLAQSASQLANLRGTELGAEARASAIRHYGIALQQLRRSLVAQSKDYTTVLAALYSVILAEHVYQGTSSGWQSHIRGAKGFVSQYLSQQPWKKSREAYIITQNFGLAMIISKTTDIKFLLTPTDDEVGELDGLLDDLMTTPIFGYTLGGTPHMLKAIYQTRLLEAQINARDAEGLPELDDDMYSRVGQILQLLYVPLHDKLETYVSHRELNGITVLPRLRTLARIHLGLFNNAVMIYLFCLVLRCPPSTMAEEVHQVLADAASFIDLHDGTVSIWPVFVAAAEAYTPDSQALANRCLGVFKDGGAGNRRDVQRVVHQVWSDRERIALERQCDPGEVSLDWREVMKMLNADILLL